MVLNSKLDLSYLETMSGGDENTMKTLLEALLTELNNNQQTARQLCKQQNWAELERFCHHYKSTLSFSGDKTLINANEKLGGIAKKKGSDQRLLENTLNVLERNSKSVAREVSRILKKL